MGKREFTVYRTSPRPHRPRGRWQVDKVRLMETVRALTESYTRTKARNYKAFRETVDIRTNSSNNTVYADADGNIAYFQASFIPKRDPKFDWTRPVDGSDSATDWKGLLTLDEMPNVLNPPNGWVPNTNHWPYLRRNTRWRRMPSRATWIPMARIRAASMPCDCSRGRRTSHFRG